MHEVGYVLILIRAIDVPVHAVLGMAYFQYPKWQEPQTFSARILGTRELWVVFGKEVRPKFVFSERFISVKCGLILICGLFLDARAFEIAWF